MILFWAVFFVSGCVAQPQSVVPVLPLQSLQGDEYITLEEQAIVVHHWDSDATERIPAHYPTTVYWQESAEGLFWIESVDDGFQLYQYTFSIGEQELLYWSKHEITSLSGSFQTQFLTFIEGSSLYLLTPSESTTRIAEQVVEYTWSTVDMRLAVSTADATELLTINRSGEISSQKKVRSDQPLRGLAFGPRQSLVGFVINSGLEFVEWDTKEQTTKVLYHWTATAGDRELPIEIRTIVSPDQSLAVVEEVLQMSERHVRLTEFRFSDHARTRIGSDIQIVGWFDASTPLLLKDFHLLTKNGILTGEKTADSAVEFPVFPRPFVLEQ